MITFWPKDVQFLDKRRVYKWRWTTQWGPDSEKEEQDNKMNKSELLTRSLQTQEEKDIISEMS